MGTQKTINIQNWNGYWSQYIYTLGAMDIDTMRERAEETKKDFDVMKFEDGDCKMVITSKSYDFYGNRESINIFTNIPFESHSEYDEETGETDEWVELSHLPSGWDVEKYIK